MLTATWTAAAHVDDVDSRIGQQLQQLVRTRQTADAAANYGDATCPVHWCQGFCATICRHCSLGIRLLLSQHASTAQAPRPSACHKRPAHIANTAGSNPKSVSFQTSEQMRLITQVSPASLVCCATLRSTQSGSHLM